MPALVRRKKGHVWRRDDATGQAFALKLTAAGLKAIAVEETKAVDGAFVGGWADLKWLDWMQGLRRKALPFRGRAELEPRADRADRQFA